MSLMVKAVLITAGLGLLFIGFEWNLMRKKKGGVTPVDRKTLRELLLFVVGACALVAFGVATLA